METKYVYKNPEDIGYKRFKLSKKQHNQIFKHRQMTWMDRYEYYYDDKRVILYKFYNPLNVGLNTLFFPIAVLANGFKHIKECWKDLKNLYHQKESGSFVSDNIWRDSETYNKIMDIVKNG